MKIKRNSWLYKLAVGRPSSRKEWNADNICAIGRAVLWRLAGYTAAALAIIAVAGIAFYLVGDFIAWLAAMIVMGSFIEPGPGGYLFYVAAVLATATCVVLLIGYAFTSVKKRASQAMTATAIYGAVTGKFCTKIEFVD